MSWCLAYQNRSYAAAAQLAEMTASHLLVGFTEMFGNTKWPALQPITHFSSRVSTQCPHHRCQIVKTVVNDQPRRLHTDRKRL
jgi:hypothetical protein